MINTLAQTLYDKKAFNIIAIDVRGVSSMTDYFIIAEGSVPRHVQALAREVAQKAKELGLSVFHTEGESFGDWVAIDCGEVLIHIFIPELREIYALEQLWHEGKIVPLEIKVPE